MATNKNNGKQEMEVKTREEVADENMERTRSRRVFIPQADIYETEKEIILTLDIPGANDKSVNITLEKNVLTIDAYIEPVRSGDYTLTYAEYEEGDYQRSFRLSDEIDRDNIKAVVNNGVLRLHLPKAENARMKKISVVAA
jgi:HSP20 family molecular chaperone IbpA